MSDSDVRSPRSRRRKVGQRVWILLGFLVFLSLIYLAAGLTPERGLTPGRRGGDRIADHLPCDCLTRQAVLDFLDGKTVVCIVPAGAPGGRAGTIPVRKEKISSLTIRSGDGDFVTVRVRFDLEHEGRRYPVEGDFLIVTKDAPPHNHIWGEFMGWVVPSR